MIGKLLFVFLIIHSALSQKPPENKPPGNGNLNPNPNPNPNLNPPPYKWLTLSGKEPLVIARGGFSGLFPDSSEFAIDMATTSSMTDVVLFCDLQLTSDGMGICQPDVRLENTTTIAEIFPDRKGSYDVNGKKLEGWFAMDFTFDELYNNVTLIQNIMTRPSYFDGGLPIQAVDDVLGRKTVKMVWLNVQNDAFYTQHKQSPSAYVQKVLRFYPLSYISSPDIGFLKAVQGKVNKAKTKLIFRVLKRDDIEPSTKQTYGSLVKDLNSIKAFASGILVPKDYIWPISPGMYLQPATTLVEDAHKFGLEVHASGFANDLPASYNYSYDPSDEYQQFIYNPMFVVDGLLTDFPPTASQTIACFAPTALSKERPKGKALIISHNGASGIYPGSTDLAYQQAIEDGADIIDCSVQITKDGVAFCLNSPDLGVETTALPTFLSRSSVVPEIQKKSGIFSFDLTWDEIKTLKPQMFSPYLIDYGLERHPENKNKGTFVTLPEFLDLAKKKAVPGVLIKIENAAYLASKKGLGVVSAVSTALSNATLDKQSTTQVLIESDDTSVLSQFKNVSTYKRIFSIPEWISDAPKQTVDEIKKFADGVVVIRPSLLPDQNYFIVGNTSVADEFHAANLSVYVHEFRNEFTSLAFDFFSDPTMEIATFVAGSGVDGIITEFPATASKYMRCPCTDLNGEKAILPAEPGSLVGLVDGAAAPAAAPAPALDVADVVDPPLPPVVAQSDSTPPAPTPVAVAPAKAGAIANAANLVLTVVAIAVIRLF